MTAATFGQRVRARRQELGVTQTALAAMVRRTQACVSQWENDQTEPGLSELRRLANTLETSLDWLVLGAPTAILMGTTEKAPAPLATARGTASRSKP